MILMIKRTPLESRSRGKVLSYLYYGRTFNQFKFSCFSCELLVFFYSSLRFDITDLPEETIPLPNAH